MKQESSEHAGEHALFTFSYNFDDAEGIQAQKPPVRGHAGGVPVSKSPIHELRLDGRH